MKQIKVALARVNYSQLYKVYDSGKTYRKRDVLAPYHLITLASHVRQRDIDVKIFDGELNLLNQDALTRTILDWQPKFVGFTATTPDKNLATEVCKKIKAISPETVTIVGGPHASAMPDDVAKHESVNYVVSGDGEYPLDLIINKETDLSIDQKIRDGKENDFYFAEEFDKIKSDISNKIIRGRLKTLVNQPIPAHDLLNYSGYKLTDPTRGRLNAASVMSSRGCPFECKFCFHDRNMRLKDVDKFINEIRYLVEEKEVRYFYVYDDTFTVKKARAMEILKKIKELNYEDVNFQCLTRANLVDDELVEALKKANFVRVSMGVESGSDRILSIVNKGVKKEDYVRACKKLSDAGIETRGSFILGHPFETKETLIQSINFSKELELFHANFNIMTPYPGTEIYEMAKRDR